MRTGFALGLVMVCALALPAARAEEELEPQVWPEEVPLERLVRQVSSLLDAPIVWNPDDRELVRTRVVGNLKLSFAGVPRKERVGVVRALLQFYEFDLVRCEPREQPVYVLTRVETPRGQWRPEPLSLDDGVLRTAMQQSGRLVACTVPLMVTGRKAEMVAESAQALLANSPRAFVDYVPATRRLMLRGDAPRVAAVARLLRSAGLVDEAALRR